MFLVSIIVTACNNSDNQSHFAKWNDGYDSKQPECFDTVICENGDSLLIINMAIDSIM